MIFLFLYFGTRQTAVVRGMHLKDDSHISTALVKTHIVCARSLQAFVFENDFHPSCITFTRKVNMAHCSVFLINLTLEISIKLYEKSCMHICGMNSCRVNVINTHEAQLSPKAITFQFP